jgi:hypothetical protein
MKSIFLLGRAEILFTKGNAAMNNLAYSLILAGGIFNIGFAVFHLLFWKVFHWKEDLAFLTSVNRSIMQILNLCLILLFLVMAYVSFFHTQEMLSTPLGNTLLAAFSLFWLLRMVEQIAFFRTRQTASLIITLVFFGGCCLYALPWLMR